MASGVTHWQWALTILLVDQHLKWCLTRASTCFWTQATDCLQQVTLLSQKALSFSRYRYGTADCICYQCKENIYHQNLAYAGLAEALLLSYWPPSYLLTGNTGHWVTVTTTYIWFLESGIGRMKDSLSLTYWLKEWWWKPAYTSYTQIE